MHGCDHTKGEFATADPERLARLVATASHRMRQHQDRCGLPFDRVMVFPQGRFSRQAINALRGYGYRAAVNSTVFSGDTLRIRDLLTAAVPGPVPLYGRRYPDDTFAFDLLLGKPALIVQHPHDFRDYTKLTDCVSQVRRLAPEIRWLPLGQIVPEADAAGLESEAPYKMRDRARIALRRRASEARDLLAS